MPMRIVLSVVALLLLITLPSFAHLYVEWLWFGETGYRAVFLKSLTTRGMLGFGVFAAAFAFLFANLRLAARGQQRPYTVFPGGGDVQPIILEPRHLRWLAAGVAVLAALFMSGVASGQWLLVLQYLDATPFGEPDPLFGRDAGFYIFTLPLLDLVRNLLLVIVGLALLGSGALYAISGELRLSRRGLDAGRRPRRHLGVLIAAGFLLAAVTAWIDMPRMLTSPAGIIHGASYVDVMVRLPMLQALMVVAGIGAAATVYAAFSATTWPVAAALVAWIVVWAGGGVLAAGVQQLLVTPDEQRKEAPYIARNIAATRTAFDLDRIEERQVSGDASLTLADIAEATDTRDARFWVERTALRADGIREEALHRLVEKGILKQEEGRFLWVFQSRRYPALDDTPQREVKLRIMEVLFSDQIPDPRDVVIIGLAHACDLFKEILSARELAHVADRIDQVRKLDLIGQAMSQAISDIELSLALAVQMMP